MKSLLFVLLIIVAIGCKKENAIEVPICWECIQTTTIKNSFSETEVVSKDTLQMSEIEKECYEKYRSVKVTYILNEVSTTENTVATCNKTDKCKTSKLK